MPAPDLKIDFMTAADIPAAAHMLFQAFNFHADARRAANLTATLENCRQARAALLTARQDGQLAGLVQADWIESEDSKAREARPTRFSICNMAVAPDFQGQGIGHALMKRAEDHIRSQWLLKRSGHIYLYDGTKLNDPSSRFYEKLGYRPHHSGQNREGAPLLFKPINRA